MSIRYSLDEKLAPLPWLLFGMQWLAIALPSLVIIGQVVAASHFSNFAEQVLYLQKLSFVVGSAMLIQVLWGHRLPLVMGPAAVLLVGVLASADASLSAVYTAVMVGGGALALVSAAGLFRSLQRLFTTRVVAVVLLLIAFTLSPAIRNLILDLEHPGSPFLRLIFALGLVLALFIAQRILPPLWRSTLIVIALVAGSMVFNLIFPAGGSTAAGQLQPVAGFWHHLNWPPAFEPGLILSFLICYLALAVNDLGSIQALEAILNPSGMGARVTRGMTITGLAGGAAGALGVLGPVNFSLSPGVISASGCGSRFALLPAAGALILFAFLPGMLSQAAAVPATVIGAILLFILCAQVAAGLQSLYGAAGGFRFEHGLVVGLSVLTGTIVSFIPPDVAADLPALVRPLASNGFVIGVLLALLLEHGIFSLAGSAGT